MFKFVILLAALLLSSSTIFCQDASQADSIENVNETTACEVTQSCDDLDGFEAIKHLHRQLDDDKSGTVDISETDEFIRGELQTPDGNERQIKAFHGSDGSISVLEMWQSWKQSEVHNWTVEETVGWLVDSVELPGYRNVFYENQIDGTKLPQMAVNSNHYLSGVLGIRDPIAKQKLVLKAMDAVLFGPTKNHNWMKDVILAVVVIMATTIVWYLYRQNRRSQLQVQKMMKEMDSLQKAEENLSLLQEKLDKARIEQETLQEEIDNRRKEGIAYSDPENMIYKLQEEVRCLTDELIKAHNSSRGTVPPQLQHWLQLTHEIELKNYLAKKTAAENQLRKAKEECEKLRRKGQSFMGPFRLTHGGSIDGIDTTIYKARHALSEVTQDLSERLHRWNQIERLCGFNIVSNRGLVHLEALLHGQHPPGYSNTAGSTKSMISRSGSEGTLSDDDSPGSCNNNMSSVASTASMSMTSSKTSNNAMYSHPGRRLGGPLPPYYSNEYYNQAVVPPLQTIGLATQQPIQPTGPPTGLRREEPDGDLTPHASSNPVLFQLGENASPTRTTEVPSFPPVTSQRAMLMKGPSFDGSIDGPIEEDSNANKIKNKRKGSAFMNAIRNSFTSASALADSEDNSSRGSTPALEDRRKKSVFGSAMKKISRGSKGDKSTPDRDS